VVVAGYRVGTVIRTLQPAEVTWFVARSLAFLGHVDPHGAAQRLAPLLRNARRDAAASFVFERAKGPPTAGVVALAPEPDDDDRTLRLAQPWFDEDPEDLARLVAELSARFDHEAAELDLVGIPADRVERLAAPLAGEGFDLEVVRTLRFELADVPPLGRPLSLEAWRLSVDAALRELVGRCEGWSLSDRRWAWLKRVAGPFRPDLWYVAAEAPDRPPVGYALCGARTMGVTATVTLTAAGVVPEERRSDEVLQRLVLSLLHELASTSPLGRLETTLPGRDQHLVDVLRSVGFAAEPPRPLLRRLPS
jgi:hypothetical protein